MRPISTPLRHRAGLLVLQDELPPAVGHPLELDEPVLRVVLDVRTRALRVGRAAPVVEHDGLPAFRLHRAVAGVHDRVHDVAVVEGLDGGALRVEGVEHVREHVVVAERRRLVAHREEPARLGLRLLRHVAARPRRREHLEARAEPVVEPDRAVAARDLVAQVHAPAERPRRLELREGAARVAHEAHHRVLGLDRVHLRRTPAHGLDRPHVLAHEAAADLDAVAAHVDEGAPARHLLRPEPVAVRPGVRLARAGPEHAADGAGTDRLRGPSASSACRRGPRGSRGRRRPSPRPRASPSPPRRCGRGAWCRGRPCRRGRRP